jgi:hypothetical protein
MSPSESARRNRCIRNDGWTADRQLRFLDAIARTRSVTKAAAFAGMSRESAHRLRSRAPDGLFALLWDRALQPEARARPESHIGNLSDGRLARLLGMHFRRERGDFSTWLRAQQDTAPGDRT